MNLIDIRTQKRLADIEVALTDRSLTAPELAAAIHINPVSAGQYMRELHGSSVFIESWKRSPGHIVAAYRWGQGKDAPRPRGKTAAESERERLARIRKDPDRYARYLSKSRARYAVNKAIRTPQNPFSALFMGGRHA